MRSRCLRKPRRERGAGQFEARNERTTKNLRKQIEQARPIRLNRSGVTIWLETHPEVPAGDWYKRFPSMTVCGRGVLIKTFLTPSQLPVGTEL